MAGNINCGVRLVAAICGLGLLLLAGCAGSESAAREEKWGISDDEYYQEFDESVADRQLPFTRTELARVMSDGEFAVEKTKGHEDPEAAFNFMVDQRGWDEDRLNYILIKISYIAAQLRGKEFSPGQARFYHALAPTPQEVGMVSARLDALKALLPHFPR